MRWYRSTLPLCRGVGQLLTHSRLVDVVSAVVLENPLVSVSRVTEFQVRQRHLPFLVAPIADQIANWRAGIDVSKIDLLNHPPRVKPPTLVFHGDADTDIPVQTSRDLAAAADRLNWPITYVEFPGAAHTQAWNTDRGRYESHLADFLTRTVRAA